MSKLRKAAVLLANLPAEDSAALLAKLEIQQAEVVRDEMIRVKSAEEELRSAVNDFAQENPAAKALVHSSFLAALQAAGNEDLLAAFAGEHPQTIAVIASALPRQRAVQLLATFPSELQRAVVRRIAAMRDFEPAVVESVADGLTSKLGAKRLKKSRAA